MFTNKDEVQVAVPPTFDAFINSNSNGLGVTPGMPVSPNNLPQNPPFWVSANLNDADEMRLYQVDQRDATPFGPGDLEYLYRRQDVDGSSLSSRLRSLAPISFENPLDGLRRRRMFSIDTWETTNFVWANDNPGGVFPNNSGLPDQLGHRTSNVRHEPSRRTTSPPRTLRPAPEHSSRPIRPISPTCANPGSVANPAVARTLLPAWRTATARST